MSRRSINDLWESSINRINFIKNNDIGIIGSDKRTQLPGNVYESILKENPVQAELIKMHYAIFDLLVQNYNFIDSTIDDLDGDGENYSHKIIDLILEDKRIDETIEQYKERLRTEGTGAKELEEEGIPNVEDKGLISIIKELINFKILLYMLCQVNTTNNPYVKKGEFALNDFGIVFSNNPDLFFEDRDKGIINKINSLFVNSMSTDKFHDMCDLYFNHLDEDARIFNIEEKNIDLNYNKSDDVIEEVNRTLKVISVKENSLLINSWQIDRNLFKKIIENPWFYEYKPCISANILSSKQLNDKYIPDSAFHKLTLEEVNRAASIKEIFSEERINEGHRWIVTEIIEHHKERKKNNSILDYKSNITVDLKRSAKNLDTKLINKGLPQKAIWQNYRLPSISINKINYTGKQQSGYLSQTNTVSIRQRENILGLLGAGKSTFSRIAANDIVNQGGVVVFLANDIPSCLKLASEFEEDGTKTTVLKGDSKPEEQLIDYAQNVLKNNKDLFSFFKNERKNLKILDTTSQSKAALERMKQEYIDGKSADTIYVIGKGKNNKSKKITYINPEVKDSGIYHKLRELKNAQVIIVNYSAYVKTKLPASLDIFERDFFTALHLIADAIFVDEVDLAQSNFTREYIGDMNIASSHPENKFTNNYLELLTPYVNKIRTKRISKDAIFMDTILDQTRAVSDVFAIQDMYNYKEISFKPFTLYSLQMDFLERYFEVDPREIYRLKQFQIFKNLTERAIRNSFDMHNQADYAIQFKELLNMMSDPSFYFKTKENTLRKGFAKFINTFIKSVGLIPKKSLYIDPKFKEIDEDKQDEQLEIKEVQDNSFDPTKYLNGNKISNEAYVRLLFLAEFCIFNKNQIYLNNNTLSFVYRNSQTQEKFPDNLGQLPLRQNLGIYPFAPKALIKESHSYTLKKDRDDREIVHLKMKEYKLIGDKVLTDSYSFYEGIEDTKMPSFIMMSATSYIPTSSMYHNSYTPNYLIKNHQQASMKINSRFIPIYDGDKIATVSTNKKGKQKALTAMIKELTRDNGLFDKQLEKAQNEYENDKAEYEKQNPHKEFSGRRRIIGIPVTSFELVYTIKNILDTTKFRGRVRAQFRAKDLNDYKHLFNDANLDEYITKECVNELHNEDCDIFIFVMTSVGRGYNLLQGEGSFKSLIGSMFFLVRPYLTAEDFADAIFSLHDSLPSIIKNSEAKFSGNGYIPPSAIYNLVTGVCHRVYNKLVGRNISWDELTKEERFSIVSNYLVLLYQTIGRGLRGGTDLDVFFVDGKFIGEGTIKWILENGIGENYSYTPQDKEQDSYLSIFETLTNSDDFLVQELYSKFGEGLKGIALKQQ